MFPAVLTVLIRDSNGGGGVLESLLRTVGNILTSIFLGLLVEGSACFPCSSRIPSHLGITRAPFLVLGSFIRNLRPQKEKKGPVGDLLGGSWVNL